MKQDLGIFGYYGGIWSPYGRHAGGSFVIFWNKEGWSPYKSDKDTFWISTEELPLGETLTLTTHVRGICFIGYDSDTAPFVVTNSPGTSSSIDSSGSSMSLDAKIVYPSGTVIANNIVSVTLGDEVGEYYLHTANGESYRIDDTIPVYLIEE